MYSENSSYPVVKNCQVYAWDFVEDQLQPPASWDVRCMWQAIDTAQGADLL